MKRKKRKEIILGFYKYITLFQTLNVCLIVLLSALTIKTHPISSLYVNELTVGIALSFIKELFPVVILSVLLFCSFKIEMKIHNCFCRRP